MMNIKAQIMRWVLRNDIIIIVILLPVAFDSDKMLNYILAYHIIW